MKENSDINIVIEEGSGGKLRFAVIYPAMSDEDHSIPYTRAITPTSEKDFIRWMYEFIVFWKVPPAPDCAGTSDQVERILQKDERYVKGVYEWRKHLAKFTGDRLEKIGEYVASSYTIKETVRILRLSHGIELTERTIRFYEAQGLIPKSAVIAGRKRIRNSTMEEILKIKNLQGKGKSIGEIKGIMDKNQL